MGNWLSRIDKDTKEHQQKRIFEAWLSCHTQEEIAEAEGLAVQSVSNLVESFSNFGNLAESGKAAASHAADFEAPPPWVEVGPTGNLSSGGSKLVPPDGAPRAGGT